MNRLALLPLLLPLPLLAGTVLCVDPLDAGCEATIQAAVDAAPVGSTVEIRRPADGRRYVESVTVATDGLTIRGAMPVAFTIDEPDDLRQVDWLAERMACSGVQLNVCGLGPFDSCAIPSFFIDASDVTIAELTFGGGTAAAFALRPGADGFTADRNCFLGGRRIIGFDNTPVADLTLSRNRAFNHGGATRLFGDRMRFEMNLLHQTYGIELEGEDAIIDLNAMHFFNDDVGVSVEGDGATITRNDIMGAVDAGIAYVGVGGVIGENRINGVSDGFGIHVRGDGFFGAVIPVVSEQVLVRGNHVVGASQTGIELFANNSIVIDNVVERSAISLGRLLGSAPSRLGFLNAGIRVRGSDNRVEDNTVTLAGAIGIRNGDGFTPSDRNQFIDNRVSLSAMNGLLVYAGDEITVSGNEILDNDGEGLSTHDRADDVIAGGNTITGNRLDVCNCGADLMLEGNTIGSGSELALCLVAAEIGSVCGDLLFRDGFEADVTVR